MKKLLLALFLLVPTLAFAQTPPPSETYAIVSAKNVNPIDCSGTITTGGTAQPLFTIVNPSTLSNIRGFLLMNVDTTAEGLCISFNGSAGAATCSTTGYYFLQPATATASGGSYSSPLGSGLKNNVFVVAATNGHKFTCTYW